MFDFSASGRKKRIWLLQYKWAAAALICVSLSYNKHTLVTE